LVMVNVFNVEFTTIDKCFYDVGFTTLYVGCAGTR